MANLDTTSKRRSGQQQMQAFVLAPPAPDGSLTKPDRQHIAMYYSGIAAASAGGAKPWVYRQHTYTLGAGFVRAS